MGTRRQLLAEELGDKIGIPAERTAAPSAQHDLPVAQGVHDVEGEANAVAHGAHEGVLLDLVLLAGATRVGGGHHEHVGVSVDLLA